MYCSYQDRQELEDDLYREDEEESEGSEATSELEFHLYGQLHYSSNTGTTEGQDGEDRPRRELHASEKPTVTAVSVELEDSAKKRKASLNDKRVKQKKEKSCPQLRRPSSGFEQVIVIDSGPEVITVSDDSSSSSSDDDEGVCALKGGIGGRALRSTPAQKAPRNKVTDITPVTLPSSSSEESESDWESYLSSDSDVLENWMILGRGNEDGDRSISLNLEGSTDNNADLEVDNDCSWLVSNKDREAQIFNKERRARTAISRVANRYYTDKNVHCRNCDKTGHLSKNCPDPRKMPVCFLCGDPSHVGSNCPFKHCNNCGLPGHLYDSCSERAYYHKRCHRCGMTGHFFDACPEIWRQYHISTETGPPFKQKGEDNGRSPAYCYNCSRKGHFGHGCTRQRMFRGTYATTPFINHYDTTEDINRRQHRLKFKVKELKENGLMPNGSRTPCSPGPPKKKQKVVSPNNGHPFHRKAHRTWGCRAATPSHVFFHHGDDSRAAVFPKSKSFKGKQQESAGKRWKPKRAVPRERVVPPKLDCDEDADFPRGRGAGEKTQQNDNSKKRKRKKDKEVSSAGLKETLRRTPPAGKSKKDKREQKRNQPHLKMAAPIHPTDENLFNIKQRKRKRWHRAS
ncbi:zinc finger CCHC domain-containing protein 7 [Syngnathoides biaculeatus]|uniref:zinc finger CCHC domain-containing protein 7 n=1 Tax=Syngnathoides biaculeatus TaxID=300417 RepID=UPI002ADD78C4|nr:zinc finger CCHC domain-containing protein 7 [Syngnathoides biaculeatus]XP_061685680.1 zinc finger CCHC domain-containing protein 7 [Syngnathoides biaculeatus]XP_061685681.1 zinc finger CCHC domain-containing protein 7 [Syngnathoides biaculeatus]